MGQVGPSACQSAIGKNCLIYSVFCLFQGYGQTKGSAGASSLPGADHGNFGACAVLRVLLPALRPVYPPFQVSRQWFDGGGGGLFGF